MYCIVMIHMCKIVVENIKESRHGPLNSNQPGDNKAVLVN